MAEKVIIERALRIAYDFERKNTGDSYLNVVIKGYSLEDAYQLCIASLMDVAGTVDIKDKFYIIETDDEDSISFGKVEKDGCF